MEFYNVFEVCSCGAQFKYKGDTPRAAVKEWRETHRHEPARANEPVLSSVTYSASIPTTEVP